MKKATNHPHYPKLTLRLNGVPRWVLYESGRRIHEFGDDISRADALRAIESMLLRRVGLIRSVKGDL